MLDYFGFEIQEQEDTEEVEAKERAYEEYQERLLDEARGK